MIKIKKEKKITTGERSLIDKAWSSFDKELYGSDFVSLGTFYFKAFKDNQLVGLATAEIEGGVAVIEEFIVLKKYRGNKIGSQLINEVITFAKEKACHKIMLETDPRIRTANFYKKIGFIKEATIPNSYAKKPSIVLSLYLNKIN